MVQPIDAQRRQLCRLSDEITYLSYQSNAWVVSDPKTNGAVPTKSCDCENIGANHFCFLSNDESHCSATSNGDKPPLCFRQTFIHSIAQMFWTPMYFSMIILFLSLFTTKSGKTARNYAIGKCFPRYLKTQNERAINAILERERRVRREFRAIRNGFVWRPDGMREKISLKLKTKKLNLNTRLDATVTATDGENVTSSFEEVSESAPISTPEPEAPKPLRSKRSGDEYVSVASQDKDITCSICMVDIEDGERVADLPCGHNFHIACLKTWVLWRNTCPLCNAPDIAETHTTLVPHDPEAEDNPNPPTRNIYLEANSTFHHTFGMNEDSRPTVGSLSSVLSAGALARSRPR